jgi:16S rRNA (cytidine1402-2'-O)-methyltransferase
MYPMEKALFVVSTPIGNLRDITLRALDTLKETDFIACEDTRVTGIILKTYDIHKEMVSVNAFSEKYKIESIIERIINGESCALVSDAGTPGISDPGSRLISAAIKNNVPVIVIPGPSAAIAALTLSGLPTDSFVFEGFIPQKKGRQKKLKQLAEEDRTTVLYESAYRIEKLLEELCAYFGGRQIAVCRELTKKFEEVWRGTPEEILSSIGQKVIKGEFCIVIAPPDWKAL